MSALSALLMQSCSQRIQFLPPDPNFNIIYKSTIMIVLLSGLLKNSERVHLDWQKNNEILLFKHNGFQCFQQHFSVINSKVLRKEIKSTYPALNLI